jgi:hypothetical protein
MGYESVGITVNTQVVTIVILDGDKETPVNLSFQAATQKEA